jgi:hypothetical protein
MVTLLKRMLSIVLVALSSCNNSDKNSSLIFEELNESLERSNEAIDNSTNYILLSLESKSHETVTAERAVFWLSKADSIHANAKQLIEFINELKFYSKEKKIDIGQRNSNDLYKRLKVFNEFILNSDPYIKTEFKEGILGLNKNNSNELEFNQVNFTDKDELKTKTALLKFENDVRVSENRVIAFCNQQALPGCNLAYGMVSAIATSNSTKFGIREELVINLGVGEFNLANKPSFFVNGINIPPNENGIGEYKMSVGNKPGKYKAHVQIKYSLPDGKPSSLEKDIEYTVVE